MGCRRWIPIALASSSIGGCLSVPESVPPTCAAILEESFDAPSARWELWENGGTATISEGLRLEVPPGGDAGAIYVASLTAEGVRITVELAADEGGLAAT
jgi:hypothetical protein